MALPIVVIVGRPNVGKSSLLNMLAGQRISIVDPRSGITRDRVATVVAHEDHHFELVDTGGIGIVDDDHLEEHVEAQIQYAIDHADLVLFLVDVTAGIAGLDQTVTERLRRQQTPVILTVNKVDDPAHEPLAAEFARLGFDNTVCVSAAHGTGRTDLLNRIVAALGPTPHQAPEHALMKLAIVGKRNAGKSTLVNALAGEQRVIVSETPGTTRDAVDVRFEKDGRQFIAIDTAGVRKKARMDDIEFYSHTRALRSIRRADVVLLIIDALVPVAEVDLKLASAILDEYKPVVIAINKWDLAEKMATVREFESYLTGNFPMLNYAPIIFMSAATRRNVDAAIELALSLHQQARMRVGTGQLNKFLQEILELRGPSAKRGTKPVKLYYATQVATAPPTFVCFCNDPALVRDEYRRFMENRLRERLPMNEVPLRLWFRQRTDSRV